MKKSLVFKILCEILEKYRKFREFQQIILSYMGKLFLLFNNYVSIFILYKNFLILIFFKLNFIAKTIQ